MPAKLVVRPREIEDLQAYLKTVPRGSLKAALAAFSAYLLGDESHGLRHYVPYKYVTRKSAYGVTFFSDKQRRYVMAKIRSGEINPGVPHRTGRLAANWQIKGEPYKTRIENKTPYAPYVMGNTEQSRHEKKVGWRTVATVVANNLKGGMVKARAAVHQFLASRKKG